MSFFIKSNLICSYNNNNCSSVSMFKLYINNRFYSTNDIFCRGLYMWQWFGSRMVSNSGSCWNKASR